MLRSSVETVVRFSHLSCFLGLVSTPQVVLICGRRLDCGERVSAALFTSLFMVLGTTRFVVFPDDSWSLDTNRSATVHHRNTLSMRSLMHHHSFIVARDYQLRRRCN